MRRSAALESDSTYVHKTRILKRLLFRRLSQILLQPQEDGIRKGVRGEVEVAVAAKPKHTSGNVKIQGGFCDFCLAVSVDRNFLER